MACTIDATVAGADANSYASILAADAYHGAHLENESWDDLDVDQKCQALQQATRMLDAQMSWAGWVATSTQALQWPRYGAVGRNGYPLSPATVPIEVIRATAELARRLYARSKAVAAAGNVDTSSMKRLKAGPVEIEYREGVSTSTVTLDTSVMADDVFFMLEGFGTLRQRGVGSIRLTRV